MISEFLPHVLKTRIRWTSLCLVVLAVAGCQQPGREQIVDGNGSLQTFQYAANGKQYEIRYKWDSILAGYGADISRISNPGFAGGPEEDAEAQNTLRDAFRAKVCNPGLHPGLLQLGYGYSNGKWGAKLKCTSKFQANV